MKIKLSYFLGKRKTNIKDLCRNYRIKSYNSLCDFLQENRVEEPSEKDVSYIFRSEDKKKSEKPASQKGKSSSLKKNSGNYRPGPKK